MLLNRIEFALMNNPVRAAIQRYFEAPLLLRIGGPMHGGRALEIGCGRGVGANLILQLFGADSVDAFDLDPRMVALARRRLRSQDARVRLWVGDAAAIATGDAFYDAVFDFGIIHHIPQWRSALDEVARVLRPGGLFYAEEVLGSFIGRSFVRRFLDHPETDRFDVVRFRAALEHAGLVPQECRTLAGSVVWFTARKSVATPE